MMHCRYCDRRDQGYQVICNPAECPPVGNGPCPAIPHAHYLCVCGRESALALRACAHTQDSTRVRVAEPAEARMLRPVRLREEAR